jgi:N6-L-threonylcarbamoyladenine synthase
VSAAKAIALAIDIPYVGVHHHEAHVYAAMLEDPALEPPIITLVVSGGHTLLIAMDDHGRYRVLGQTVDDAAGEAFDKVARFLGLGYPGGPAIDRIAQDGDPNAIAFPRPMLDDSHDFSFSGLKTAVVQYVRKHPEATVADVAASFQAAVVDVLVTKLVGAARETGIRTVVAGGGVAANSQLRERLLDLALSGEVDVVLPGIALCTDNAAMVGAVAAFRLASDGPSPLDDAAVPGLRL